MFVKESKCFLPEVLCGPRRDGRFEATTGVSSNLVVNFVPWDISQLITSNLSDLRDENPLGICDLNEMMSILWLSSPFPSSLLSVPSSSFVFQCLLVLAPIKNVLSLQSMTCWRIKSKHLTKDFYLSPMKRQVNLNSQVYNFLGSHNTSQKVTVAVKTKILQDQCYPYRNFPSWLGSLVLTLNVAQPRKTQEESLDEGLSRSHWAWLC